MVMNLYILFFVSLPEAFFNEIVILIFAGAKDKLKVNKPNILRFAASMVLVLTASWLIRPIAPNVVVNMALHIVAYVLINTLIYRLNIKYSIMSVAFALLCYITINITFIPYIVKFIYGGMKGFANAYYLYPLFSLPMWICQFIMASFLWKYEFLMATKINNRFHNFFIATFLILAFTEYSLVFIFYDYSDKLPLAIQIVFSFSLLIMTLVFNLMVFRFVHIVINGIVARGYRKYSELEDDVKFAFNELRDLLKSNNVDEAIKLIDDLNGKNDNNN
jgi:hypothetical protein